MTQTKTKPDGPTGRVSSASAWKKRKVHKDITLPSGAQVDVELPNLAQLVKSGTLPNELLEAAVKQNRADEISRELLEETWDFTRFIVPLTVASPKIEASDVDELPIEDVEMLAAFAARRTDIDAVGHHLAGLEAVASFRDLRGLITTDPALFDV